MCPGNWGMLFSLLFLFILKSNVSVLKFDQLLKVVKMKNHFRILQELANLILTLDFATASYNITYHILIHQGGPIILDKISVPIYST